MTTQTNANLKATIVTAFSISETPTPRWMLITFRTVLQSAFSSTRAGKHLPAKICRIILLTLLSLFVFNNWTNKANIAIMRLQNEYNDFNACGLKKYPNCCCKYIPVQKTANADQQPLTAILTQVLIGRSIAVLHIIPQSRRGSDK